MSKTFTPGAQHRQLVKRDTADTAKEIEAILATVAAGGTLSSAEFAKLAVAALSNEKIAAALVELRQQKSQPVSHD